MNCPCQSQKDFTDCCEPILKGQPASRAEELMRARYTAYTLVDMDFIAKTTDPKSKNKIDMDGNKEWAESTKWLGLEILNTTDGEADDDTGVVEFRAHYENKKGKGAHHEISQFTKRKGTWYFTDGTSPQVQSIRRDQPKIGRNDPCSCGSEKKYKKCCGA